METEENLCEGEKVRVRDTHIALDGKRVPRDQIRRMHSAQIRWRLGRFTRFFAAVWFLTAVLAFIGALSVQKWEMVAFALFFAVGTGAVVLQRRDISKLSVYMNGGPDIVYQGDTDHVSQLKLRIEVARKLNPNGLRK